MSGLQNEKMLGTKNSEEYRQGKSIVGSLPSKSLGALAGEVRTIHGEKKTMSRIACTLVLTACLFLSSGCDLLESATSNVGGWDVSACASGFSVCWELFSDNADKFEDTFVSALDAIEFE